MTRDVLTRSMRRDQRTRHEQHKWERMTPEQRDAAMMRAMDEALTARSAVTKQDMTQAGIPKDFADRRWPDLLQIVIKARPGRLPVLGTAQ